MVKSQYKDIICNRINQLRIEHELTGEALAYVSDLSKGGICEILNHKKLPDTYTIAKICAGLGITMKAFFDFKEVEDFIDLI